MIELSLQEEAKLTQDGLMPSDLKNLFESDELDFYIEMCELQGLSLIKEHNSYIPKQLHQNISDCTFCVVDVESNGSKIGRDQIIEIGAVKVHNGKVIDTFESLIYCNDLQTSIAELTGIKASDLILAPSIKEVMHKFKLFLGDSIIVAHPITFDYTFLSHTSNEIGLGKLLNLNICNIALAERTLSSAKYGLNYLNKTLELDEDHTQHRALHDALLTEKIFQKCLERLPKEVKTFKELYDFHKKGEKQPRAALVEFEES